MKVLLISANTEKINMHVLPLGLACVAQAARDAGHEVNLINLMDSEDVGRALGEAIVDFRPGAIGISVRNIDDQSMEGTRFLLDAARETVEACRRLSDAPIVLGGAGYSIFPDSALDYLRADMGIQGEGEVAFPLLLDRLEKRLDVSETPGLYLPGRGVQGRPVLRKDLDRCPLPPPQLLVSGSSDKNREIWLPFQTRRGCPMGCSYCSTSVIEGRSLRKRDVEKVAAVLSTYAEAGFTRFFFVDNTFNLPPSYAKALCQSIIDAGLRIEWRCIVYPWKVDDALAEKMAQAGCKEASLGFESGAADMLRSLKKRFQPEDVRLVSERLKRHGIAQMGFLLLGGPGETEKSVQESLLFADSLNLDAVKATVGIRIYPKTRLSRIALEERVIESEGELLSPKFYIASGVKGWLRQTVNEWMKKRDNWMS